MTTDPVRIVVVGGEDRLIGLIEDALRRAGGSVELHRVDTPSKAAELIATLQPDIELAQGFGGGHAEATELAAWPNLFRKIVEHSRDLYYVHGPDHVLTYLSPQSRHFFGYEPEEALVRWTGFATDNPVNAAGIAATQRAIDTGERQPPYQLELKDRFGHSLWVEVREQPVVERGRTIAIIGAISDITERKQVEEKLTLLAQAIRSIGEGVCMTDAEDRIQFVNHSFCTMYGYTEHELLGRDIAILRPADVDQATVARVNADTLDNGFRGELWNIRKDGSRLLISLSTSTVRDDQGAPLALIGVVRDVTERRLFEDALRESEDRYRDLVENSEDLICTHDLVGTILSVNHTVERMTGYSVDEIIGHNLKDFMSKRGKSQFGTYLATIAREGEAGGVMEIVTKTRELRYWEYENSLRTEGVSEAVVRGRAHDISERLRAEKALRDSEERYRTFFEQDLTADFIAGVDGKLFDVNPAFVSIFGFTSVEEALATSVGELYANPSERNVILDRLRREGTITAAEIEMRRRDGSPVHVVGNAVGIFEKEGDLVAVRAYLFDITTHRATEEQLRQAQKMEAVGRLAGGVAHDFNNLLQAMLATVEVVKRHPGIPDEASERLQELEIYARRGASLTRQLLLFARKDIPSSELVVLDDMIRESMPMLRRLVRENIRIEQELAASPSRVRGDKGQLEQVLVNLVVNAVDAMPEGGTIGIRSGIEGDTVWCEVRDTGIGMAESVLARVFEPFFTTKGRESGTGLGLAVAHGIVARHHGKIEVSSTPQRGSRFRIVLPATELSAEVGDSQCASELAATLGGTRVLLVEDEPTTREGLRQLIEMLGYEATAVPSGEAARALPHEPPFAAIVTDFLLPGINGLELARELRGRWPDIAVILMSGYAERVATETDLKTEEIRFLQKPFGVSTLARTLSELLATS